MDKKILNSLVADYKNIFTNVSERSGFEYRKYHGLRVFKDCSQWIEMPFLKDKAINRDALIVAALFHDIGKIKRVDKNGFMDKVDDNKDKHEVIGAEIVGDYIGKYFHDESFVKKVGLIIKGHCGDDISEEESYVLRDADAFDNFGFVQIIRMVAYGERNGRNVEKMVEYWDEVQRGDFVDRLTKFNFDEVRKLAKERLNKLDSFFDNLKEENEILSVLSS